VKIGVFVGSFNPVHKGHIKIINHLLDKYIDKVIIIPTQNYWHKNNLIDINDRINMLKIYENDRIIIDTLNNNEPYTYKILENLKNKYPNDELYLIIGADNIVNFDKWKEYKTLLKNNIILINRDDIDVKFYLDKLDKKDKYIITTSLPYINISSTDIRKYIRNDNYDIIKDIIDYKVYIYIKNNKLYI